MEAKIKEAYRLLLSLTENRVQLATKKSRYCTDFGHFKFVQPQIVVHASSERDLRRTLKIANSFKIPVSIRGAGHSSNGQTLTKGILIVYSNKGKKIIIMKNRFVKVKACMTWYLLEKTLNAHSLSTPILTGALHTTIGGTLSVGGIGVRSCKYGAQIDQVVRLKLILASGSAVWCSPKKHRALFQFVLGGLGTLGVIESVILRTIPHKPFSITSLLREKNILPDTLNKFINITNQPSSPDWAEASICRSNNTLHCKILSGKEYTDKEIRNFPSPNIQINHHFLRETKINATTSHKNMEHYWSDYVLEVGRAKKFVKHLSDRLPAVYPYLSGIYFLAIKRPAFSPELCFHPAKKKKRLYISVGLYLAHPLPGNSKVSTRINAFINKLYRLCLQLNGRPYLHGIYPINRTNMRKFYEPRFNQFIQLKRKYDPNQIFPFQNFWGHFDL
jgi:FAD/FMN-containing dehydrogenase